MGFKSSTPPALQKTYIFCRMSGLIVTAKAFHTQLKKKRMQVIRDITAAKDMGIDPGYTVDDVMDKEIDRIAEDFRMQCRLAVKLRDIAMEEGLIKKEDNGTPRLEDSPVLKSKYALITVRPEAGTCLLWFEQAVKTFMERPWIIGAEYHFEQTGTDYATLGEGFHVHIVVKCKSSIRVSEILKHIASDIECRASVEIGNRRNKFLKTERDLEYALNYVRGDKHNDEKAEAVEMNEEWRALHELDDAYYVRDWDNRESRPAAVIIEEVH